MAWMKVETSVAHHRKFLDAGPAASWLWLCGLAYCQEGLTDGFIPFQALRYLGVKSPNSPKGQLVACGLWDEVPGGWHVHDYLKHNKDGETVRKIQAERRALGSRGGVASGEARRKQTDEPNTEANRFTKTKQTANPDQIRSDQLSSATGTPSHVRGTPIIARRRLDAAWEGPKGLYVPQRKHADFIALRNHAEAERELLVWYEYVAETWQGSPGADMMKFWTDRYGERWPAAMSATRSSRQPAWAQRAKAAQP